MASAYYGLNRGQTSAPSGATQAGVTESASASGSTDVEIRIDLTKSLKMIEIDQIITELQEWIRQNRSKFLADS